MSNYRIFNECTGWLHRVFIFVLAFFLLIAATEAARVYLILHRVRPVFGYVFLGVAALAIIVMFMIWMSGRSRRNRILRARGFVTDEKSSHKRLSRSLDYHIRICSRLASHRLLSPDRKKALVQGAHDLRQALEHHPLKDDLRRGIDTARERLIQPALRDLDQITGKIIASKVRGAVEDYYQPYFPIIAPWLVVYHQITLVSEIADIYLPRPSLREYLTVIRETWRIMREGNLLHHGQRQFASVEGACAPLGDSADDLLQAMSIVWLTHCVARTAVLRCTTYHDWNTTDSIAAMKNQLPDILQATRESIAHDALPFLKRRLFRHANGAGRDLNLHVSESVQSFLKIIDVISPSLPRPRSEVSETLATAPGAETATGGEGRDSDDDEPGEEVLDHHHPRHHSRHQHRRRRSRGAFRRFIDKLAGREMY